MGRDFEVGHVVAVDTAQVTIELNPDLKALTRSTYEGASEIGRINSYVVLPVGARRLVAMVTRVVLAEEAEVTADRTMVTLPSARHLMKATLIGTIDGSVYTQGITIFPVLDNPVHMVTEAELATIFDYAKEDELPKPEDPGFCVQIGESAIFSGYPIKINPDAFFGKHAAIIGSTGSGKSCTIASLIQSILSRDEVRRTHIIILDTNGEYQEALPLVEYSTLYIPSDANRPGERLVIPYWLMNADDFVRLFRASAGIQRPVLLDALRTARAPAVTGSDEVGVRDTVLRECHRLLAFTRSSEKSSKDIEEVSGGLQRYLEGKGAAIGRILSSASLDPAAVRSRLETVKDAAGRYTSVGRDGTRYPGVVPADAQNIIEAAIRPILGALSTSTGTLELPSVSADTPVFFAKDEFRREHLEEAMRRDEAGGARARDYCATLLMRVHRLLEDRRFEFLFKPIGGQWPRHEHALATFLRDLVGLAAAETPNPALSDEVAVPPQALPYYDRQRTDDKPHKVVIVDLSLLAAEVLENVTALIGRVILEFLQRLGEAGGADARGSLPVVLVLEEAQNYIRERRFGDEDSISRDVFERVAREGRKYGLSLVVASQRPSELSKTILSQCNSFVVHRLQNPEDLRYFKEIVPGIYGPLLDQLPALAPQTALILGECVRAPALVRIREARPLPRSRDPKFYQYWVADDARKPDVEAICARWEGRPRKQDVQ
jgi:uncharacterized protein